MKIKSIFCSDGNYFHNTTFNDGFNVILAEITEPLDKNKDTHGLGKTRLVHLIDFMLLKTIDNKKKIFLTKGGFEGLVFFIQLKLNTGKYLLIKRGVDTPSRISFKELKYPIKDYNPPSVWDKENLNLKKARTFLNEKICLNIVPNWQFRKSVTYFLRTQNDFRDIFRLDKFSRGSDKYWKPFMFDLLGFDGGLVEKKYTLEKHVAELDNKLETLQEETQIRKGQEDKILGLLQIKKQERDTISNRIDEFNFYEKEKDINRELIEDIDLKIQILNTERYRCSYEISKIEQSLVTIAPSVDIIKLKSLFDDINLHFPKNIENDFNSLIEFNKLISEEREKILEGNLDSLTSELHELESKLKEQEDKKEKYLSFLLEKDTFHKFKDLQKELAKLDGDILNLEERLSLANKTSEIDKERNDYMSKIGNQIQLIDKEISKQSHAKIRIEFNKIIKKILNRNGIISVYLNKLGNLEFGGEIEHPTMQVITDEASGTTYKKLMCMAFDLAILIVYSSSSFYRFVYHDGALEVLEHRKRILFLETIRNICSKYQLQYIMTVIDSDLPIDHSGKIVNFKDSEICLKLHDRDDNGKLFKRSF